MAASISSSYLVHRIFRPPPPSPSQSLSCLLSIFTSPIRTTATTATAASAKCLIQNPLRNTLSFPLPTRPLLLCHSLSSSLTSPQISEKSLFSQEQDEDNEIEESDDEKEVEVKDEKLELGEPVGKSAQMGVDFSGLRRREEPGLKLPSLTVKEKKELASYAHSLGKKLKSQLVGKSGVTDNVATSFIETLESNELLKIKIHGTCPGELDDVVKQLEEATGSIVVGQIGRTVIIYRPSLTKLKAEEKKKQAEEKRKQARRVFVRKEAKLKPAFPNTSFKNMQNKGQAPRLSGRGRRGSSRV